RHRQGRSAVRARDHAPARAASDALLHRFDSGAVSVGPAPVPPFRRAPVDLCPTSSTGSVIWPRLQRTGNAAILADAPEVHSHQERCNERQEDDMEGVEADQSWLT